MNNNKKEELNYHNLNEVIGLSKKMLKILYTCVILAIIVFVIILFKNLEIFKVLGSILGVISPFFIGLVIAWLLDPAVTYLQKKNVKSLIIDLRDNPGGLLDVCVDIADYLLGEGTIVYTKDNNGDTQYYKSDEKKVDLPIVVLINENSASASEILAAALQESYGAKVVGVNSFGKGTVQKAYQLESGATVKYTIQKWLTPNGNWINEKGVTPDIEVEMEGDYYQNPSDETDNQLQKALEDISK